MAVLLGALLAAPSAHAGEGLIPATTPQTVGAAATTAMQVAGRVATTPSQTVGAAAATATQAANTPATTGTTTAAQATKAVAVVAGTGVVHPATATAAPAVKTVTATSGAVVKTGTAAVLPIVKSATTAAAPVVKTAATAVAPVVKTAASAVAPIVNTATTTVAPITKTATAVITPAIEPIRNTLRQAGVAIAPTPARLPGAPWLGTPAPSLVTVTRSGGGPGAGPPASQGSPLAALPGTVNPVPASRRRPTSVGSQALVAGSLPARVSHGQTAALAGPEPATPSQSFLTGELLAPGLPASGLRLTPGGLDARALPAPSSAPGLLPTTPAAASGPGVGAGASGVSNAFFCAVATLLLLLVPRLFRRLAMMREVKVPLPFVLLLDHPG